MTNETNVAPGFKHALTDLTSAIYELRQEHELIDVAVVVGFATETRDSPVADVMHAPRFEEQLLDLVPGMTLQWFDHGHRKDFHIDGEGVTLMLRAA